MITATMMKAARIKAESNVLRDIVRHSRFERFWAPINR
jgi:hypothetical protein